MADKRVVIHLGTGKAGSTSIQHALFFNSTALEGNGFRYLTEWGEYHIHYLRNLFSPDPVPSVDRLYAPLLSEAGRRSSEKTIINTILRVVNTTDCETLVLSGEYWGELWRDSVIVKIKEFIENYFISNGIEVTIIYIVRNPLTWMISLLQEALRGGFYDRNGDYFESQIDHYYKGICNLQKYFGNSLILLKFEDAINDKDGLVGCFLKAIGFPQEEIPAINISLANESCCMEAVEFINYIEDKEPFLPFGVGNKGLVNPNRYQYDLAPLCAIKGVKFDLPYRSKVELWERFREMVQLLKTNTGIDYTDYKILPPAEQETYSEKTILGFIGAFPKLSPTLQKHFLKFFEKKYAETAQARFKQLYFPNTLPKFIYDTLNSRSWRITKPLRKINAALKRIRG